MKETSNLPPRKESYKTVAGVSLSVDFFPPETGKSPAPALVLFHGGGWTSGSPSQFYEQCRYFASRGMAAFSIEYRLGEYHRATPFESD